MPGVPATVGDVTGGARAAVLAALCALLTATGHAAGGGALPDLALLVVLLPLLGGALVPLADRTRGPVGLLAVLGAAQFGMHHVLELLHPAHAAGPVADARMVATHAVATVLLAAAVRGADRAVAAVAAALARVLPRRAGPPPAVRPLAAPRPAAPASGLRLAAALCSAEVRRGPPVRVRPRTCTP